MYGTRIWLVVNQMSGLWNHQYPIRLFENFSDGYPVSDLLITGYPATTGYLDPAFEYRVSGLKISIRSNPNQYLIREKA